MTKQELIDKQKALDSLFRRSSGVDLALASIQVSVVGLFISIYESIEQEIAHKLELKNGEVENLKKALAYYASEDNWASSGITLDRGLRARTALK